MMTKVLRHIKKPDLGVGGGVKNTHTPPSSGLHENQLQIGDDQHNDGNDEDDVDDANIGSKMNVELNIDKYSLSTTAPSIANIEQSQAPNYPEGKTSCIWSQNWSRQTQNLKLCV